MNADFCLFFKRTFKPFFLKMSILRQRKSLIKPPFPSLITVLDDTLPPCSSLSSVSFGYANIALTVPASGRVTCRVTSLAVSQREQNFTETATWKREYFVHYFLYFYLKISSQALACLRADVSYSLCCTQH